VPNRVLIDGRLIGYRYGGIATYARQIAFHGSSFARDLDIRLMTKRPVPELSDRSIRAFTPPHHPVERFSFGVELAAHCPNLVHFTDYVQSCTITRFKSVVTVHDLAFIRDPSLITQDSLAYYQQISETLPIADRVIAVSEWTRQQILEFIDIDADRVTVIPNGYEDAVFSPEDDDDRIRISTLDPELAKVIEGERPVVLAVGTLEPRKRIDIILDVFEKQWEQLSKTSRTSPVLVIAGQWGWLADDIVANVRSLLRQKRAIWLRSANPRDLAALYRVASLLVVSSSDEGFGLPVVEAMASGTPVLSSDIPAVKEIMLDNGFLEESADPARWAEKIGRILADPEIRERRGKRGIERARQFTWRESARRTVNVYRDVIRG
jgi:glycosyltransferase involved in cell wall biosynthesis